MDASGTCLVGSSGLPALSVSQSVSQTCGSGFREAASASPATATVLVTCTQYPGRKFCKFYRGEAGLGGAEAGDEGAPEGFWPPLSFLSPQPPSAPLDSRQPRLSLEPMMGTGCQALLQRGCLRVLSILLTLAAFLALVLWCQQVLSGPGVWGLGIQRWNLDLC